MSDPRDSLFTTPAMAALFAPEAHVRQMLRFEAALVRAQAQLGIVPRAAADAIVDACRIERFDVAALYREAAESGTPVIPLVRMLSANITVDGRDFLHLGATSQDVIDSALMLQMRDGLKLLLDDLLAICARCAELAQQHRHTLMAGRTLLQQALPISFGLKAARWLALVTRQAQALRTCRDRSLALQFGAATGTLAALGGAGLAVAELLSEQLELELPELPWHAERDRIASVAAALGIAAGAMAKIAQDIVQLAQTEVGEVSEAGTPGKGGSSAMPHKRNPVDATMARAAAHLAAGIAATLLSDMASEHERAAGTWQAEWAAIPDLFRYTGGAVARVRAAVAGLQVDGERMRSNLNAGGGLVMAESLMTALARHIGRAEAQRLVQQVSQRAQNEGISLRAAALDDARINGEMTVAAIDGALDPATYLGSTDRLIDRALAAYHTLLLEIEQ